MTFPKLLLGIFWLVLCKHLLNTVAMVTTFFYYTFQFLIILTLCIKNAMQTQYFLNYFDQNKVYHRHL